jgi:5-methylcytosine-specific restriction endonuclease McrA
VQIDEDGLKRCSKCKERKDPSGFGKHPSAKDGLQTACKDCYAKYQAERRKNVALKATDAAVKKRSMAKRKGYYQEQRNKNRRKQRQDPVFRAKELANQRAWRAKDGRTAQENHARRARRLAAQVAGPVPPGTYNAVLASGPCVYCGAPAECVDHVIPLSRGGHEAEHNLVPACNPCNWSKGPKLLAEWDQARVARAVIYSAKVAAAA